MISAVCSRVRAGPDFEIDVGIPDAERLEVLAVHLAVVMLASVQEARRYRRHAFLHSPG
jgi:hypothetical protein